MSGEIIPRFFYLKFVKVLNVNNGLAEAACPLKVTSKSLLFGSAKGDSAFCISRESAGLDFSCAERSENDSLWRN